MKAYICLTILLPLTGDLDLIINAPLLTKKTTFLDAPTPVEVPRKRENVHYYYWQFRPHP